MSFSGTLTRVILVADLELKPPEAGPSPPPAFFGEPPFPFRLLF